MDVYFPSSEERCPTQNRKQHREKNLHHHTTSRRKHPRSTLGPQRQQGARGHDSCSGNDGTGNLLKGTVNNMTVGSATGAANTNVPLYFPLETESAKSIHNKTGMSTTLSMNWNWKCDITTKNQRHTCPSGPYRPGRELDVVREGEDPRTPPATQHPCRDQKEAGTSGA